MSCRRLSKLCTAPPRFNNLLSLSEELTGGQGNGYFKIGWDSEKPGDQHNFAVVTLWLYPPEKLSITWMAAGPRITPTSTGRKNRIIGTVSFGGRAAAFFSASVIR